jgi:hypothetical protein
MQVRAYYFGKLPRLSLRRLYCVASTVDSEKICHCVCVNEPATDIP